MQCCQAHKTRTGCNGKRDRTSFVALGSMNDGTLNSDYFFLEDVLDQVESGKRLLKQVGVRSDNPTHKRLRMNLDEPSDTTTSPKRHIILRSAGRDNVRRLSDRITAVASASIGVDASTDKIGQNNPENRTATDNTGTTRQQPQQQNIQHPKWRFLFQQAAARGTGLLLMPSGMSRHKENRSFYNKKTNSISWTTEWFLYSGESSSTPTRGVLQLDEKAVLCSALQRDIPELAKKDALYYVLLKKLPCPASRPTYVVVERTATLSEALQDMTIIEYPTIYIVPRCRKEQFPLAVEEMG